MGRGTGKRTHATNKHKRDMAALGTQKRTVSPWSRDLKRTVEVVFHCLILSEGCWDNWDASQADNDKYPEFLKKSQLLLKTYDDAKAKRPLPEPCRSGHRRKDCPKGKAHHFSNKDESFRIRRLFDSCPVALENSSSMQDYFRLIEVETKERIRHGGGENLPSYSYRDSSAATALSQNSPVALGVHGNGSRGLFDGDDDNDNDNEPMSRFPYAGGQSQLSEGGVVPHNNNHWMPVSGQPLMDNMVPDLATWRELRTAEPVEVEAGPWSSGNSPSIDGSEDLFRQFTNHHEGYYNRT